MEISILKAVLLWCVVINYAVLILWFLVILVAHDALYSLHSRWFRLTVEQFDTIMYASMAVYKIGIILLNLVPLVALLIAA